MNGFDLVLSFNTHATGATRLGGRWRDTFDRKIVMSGANAVAYRPDGKVLQFVPSGGGWATDADTADRLTQLPGGAWQLYVAVGDELENYDTSGKLQSIASRSGLTQTLTYSDGTSGPNGGVYLYVTGLPSTATLPTGILIRVSDHFGRTLAFNYYLPSSLNAVLAKVTDPAGGAYKFNYDQYKNLLDITFPDNKVKTFHYNEPANTGGANLKNALTGITDENAARFATYQFNALEQVVRSEHAGGAQRYTFAYSAGSTIVTDPLNTARTYSFQNTLGAFKNTDITGAVCPTCGPAAQTFDANGNVATRTDWNGNRTDYSYDLARNLETSRTEGLTGGGATTPATRIIETQWHATFRLPTQVTDKNSGGTVLRTTGMTYDTNGTLLTRTVTAGAGSRAWTYTYNANGSVLTMNGPRTDVADVTTYTYYDNAATCPGTATMGCRGQVLTITNAAGHVTEFTGYNAHGQPLTILDPNGLTTTLGYDVRQRITSRNVGGETTSYEYDGVGQLTRVTLPDGSFLSYTYDAAHRLTQIADNLGNRIAYTLDAMGNRTAEEVRDPANQLAQIRSRIYSNLNRLAQEIGAQNQTTTYAYDNQGNVTSIDGPLPGTVDVTANAYDTLNRLVRVTDPNSGQVNYDYNALDQLASVTDPRSLATSYHYDGLNNLNQLVSPDTGATSNAYDAAGNLLTQTDAKGQVTSYAYDALNRVIQIMFHDASRQTYSYDQGANGVGRLSGITETDAGNLVTSQLAYAYDPKGRITAETRTINGIAYLSGYSFDASGRLTGMTYPSGRSVAYTLDSLGRIAQVDTTRNNLSQTILSGVAYRPFGPAQSFTFGNGQTYTRGFDQDARIASYTLGTQSFAVGYDAAGRIGFISDLGNPANSNTYAYDNLDRLIGAVTPGTPFAYSYDAVSNRLSKTVGASTDTYILAATSNRLASITPGAGPVRNLLYDANGATTNDGINQYAYDPRGRLVRAVTVLGTVQYQVNALGQRIAKILPGSVGGSSQTLFSDTFPGPDGRPIDDQADGLWKGGGKQIAARVIGGQAEIAPGRQLRTAADFALPGAGLMLQARLARGKVALLNVAQDEGLIVRYAGSTVAVARARDYDGDDLADDANVRARFELSSPGAVLQLVMELRPGAARVRIAAGTQSFDTGEIALGAVQAGERYRVRLAAVKLKGQALSGLVDDVLLTVPGGGAPLAATTHFVYDTQGRLIGEYTGQGAMMREYAYLQDLPLALIEPSGAVFFIHTDHLNTPRVITNQARQAVWRWDHAEPFGSNPPNENPSGLGTFTSNLRLPGQYFDKETNSHYNWWRTYFADLGRYGQSDPIGLRGGINTYIYAKGNPLVNIDPDGLQFFSPRFPRYDPSWGRVPSIGPVPFQWPPSSPPSGNRRAGFTEQDYVCSAPVGIYNAFGCALQCCIEHDACYERHKCNASSWGGPMSSPCQVCNMEAVRCILTGSPQGACQPGCPTTFNNAP